MLRRNIYRLNDDMENHQHLHIKKIHMRKSNRERLHCFIGKARTPDHDIFQPATTLQDPRDAPVGDIAPQADR